MKRVKVKVYLPIWAKPGCKVLKTWFEPINSGDSNGVGTFVKYLDAKGKERSCMKWVKWFN